MGDLAAMHRVFELETEFLGRAHAAARGERPAEHHRAFGELAILGITLEQVARMPHRADRTLLIELAFAAFGHVRAQDQAVPVRHDLVIGPELRRDRLVAHLLGDADAIGLDLAVGVVGAQADPEPPAVLQQDVFGLAAGGLADRFDLAGAGEARRRDAVKDRRGGRPLHAQFLEFLDVLLDRRGIAAGPAGDHGVTDRNFGRCRLRPIKQRQRKKVCHIGSGMREGGNSVWSRTFVCNFNMKCMNVCVSTRLGRSVGGQTSIPPLALVT